MYFKFLLNLYYYLFKYSIITFFLFFWYTIGFYDRTHVRIKSHNLGKYIYKFFENNLPNNFYFEYLKKTKIFFNNIFFRQLTIIFDSNAGFFEGLNNEDIIINIDKKKFFLNENIETINNKNDYINDNMIEESQDISTSYEIKENNDNNQIFNRKNNILIDEDNNNIINNLNINKEISEKFPNELIVNNEKKKKVIIKISKKKN